MTEGSAAQRSMQVSSEGVVDVANFTGIVIVKTGPNMKFDARIENGPLVASGKIDAPVIEQSSDGLSIRGDKSVKIKQCKTNDNNYRLKLEGDKLRSLDDYPRLEISMPEGATFNLGLNSGYAKIDNVYSANVAVNGCGDVFMQNVESAFVADINGSGDVEAKNTGSVTAQIRGSGDILVGDVADFVNASIKGSGDIELNDVGGELSAFIMGSGDIQAKSASKVIAVDIRGSGDVRVDDGEFQTVDLNIAGSGDINVGGIVQNLNVSIRGSGDITIEKLEGEISGNLAGSGELTVDGEEMIYKNGRWYRPT